MVARRDLDEAAIAARGPAPGRHQAVEAGGAVRPDDDVAAIAVDPCVGVEAHPGIDRDGLGIADVGIGALEAAAEMDLAAADVAGDAEQGLADRRDLGTLYPDLAAARAAACRARGVDRTAELDAAALARVDRDIAAGAVRAPALDGAAELDRAPGTARAVPGDDAHRAVRSGGQAGTADDAAIVDRQGVDVAAGRRQLGPGARHQALIVDAGAAGAGHPGLDIDALRPALAQQDALPGAEPDHALLGDQGAVILHPLAQHDDIAIAGGDGAQIGDRRGAVALEADVAAIEEILVGDVEGGGDEAAAGGDDAAGADHHAAAVDQIDRPRGVEPAIDLRHRAAGDAVQRRAAAIVDGDRAALADREGVPVDDAGIGRLVDRHGRTSAGDRALSGDVLAAGGQFLSQQATRKGAAYQCRCEQPLLFPAVAPPSTRRAARAPPTVQLHLTTPHGATAGTQPTARPTGTLLRFANFGQYTSRNA